MKYKCDTNCYIFSGSYENYGLIKLVALDGMVHENIFVSPYNDNIDSYSFKG